MLRARVLSGAREGATFASLAQRTGHTEVDQPCSRIFEEDVLRLEIEMGKTRGMNCPDGIAQRARDSGEFTAVHLAGDLAEAMRQGGWLEQFQREERRPIGEVARTQQLGSRFRTHGS